MVDVDDSGEIDTAEFDAAFYAARLSGGIDIYIPSISRDKGLSVGHLESDEFRQKLLHGWKK